MFSQININNNSFSFNKEKKTLMPCLAFRFWPFLTKPVQMMIQNGSYLLYLNFWILYAILILLLEFKWKGWEEEMRKKVKVGLKQLLITKLGEQQIQNNQDKIVKLLF